MIPLDPNVQLDARQKNLATRAMLQVAQVDAAGTPEELLLIRNFYEDGSEITPFAQLVAESATVMPLPADAFPESAQCDLVIALCLMVAHADGHFSPAERTATQAIAAQIGMTAERHDQLLMMVRENLMAQIAGLPDSGSVAQVAQELI